MRGLFARLDEPDTVSRSCYEPTRALDPALVLALEALLQQPDPPDLVGVQGGPRGTRVTCTAWSAKREATLQRLVDVHLAERLGWHATVTRDASTRRHLRAVSR